MTNKAKMSDRTDPFDWSGGHPALDLVNTLDERPFTLSDPAAPKLRVAHQLLMLPGGTHTPLPLPGRKLAIVADEANAEKCAKGMFHTFVVDMRAPENPVPITLPVPKDGIVGCWHLRPAQSA